MAEAVQNGLTRADILKIIDNTKKTEEYAAASAEEQRAMRKQSIEEGKIQRAYEKRVEDNNEKIQAKQDKIAEENKFAQTAQLAAIADAGIADAEFNEQILADLKQGITYDEEKLKAQYAQLEDLRSKEAKEAQARREA